MQKKIKNLFNTEEWIILNLKNAGYQVKTYLTQLDTITAKYHLGELNDKAVWFKQIFEYYKEDLIPAIQETAEMEKRHIEIFERNPDVDFDPQVEVDNHQQLTRQFLTRFEQLHKSFYDFTISAKKCTKK